MNRVNWEIIEMNIIEAKAELGRIGSMIASKNYPSEMQFKVMLSHAYHHMNFAWNIRRVTTKRYANLTDDDYQEWSAYPDDMKE